MLEPVATPYLAPKTDKRMTLVLDLDETLIHYAEKGEEGSFQIRPYANVFLETLSKYYEVVIFTAALQDVSRLTFSMQIGFLTNFVRYLLKDFTDSMRLYKDKFSSKIFLNLGETWLERSSLTMFQTISSCNQKMGFSSNHGLATRLILL